MIEAIGYIEGYEPQEPQPIGYLVEDEKKKKPVPTFAQLREERGLVPAAGMYALKGVAEGISKLFSEDESKRNVIRTPEGEIVGEAGVEQLASPVDVLVGSIPLGRAAGLAKAAIRPGIGAAKKGLAEIALRQSLREAAEHVPVAQAVEKPIAQAIEKPISKAVEAVPIGEIIPEKSTWMGKIVSGQDPLLQQFEKNVEGAIPKKSVTRAQQIDLAQRITGNVEEVQKLLSKKATGEFSAVDQVALADVGDKTLKDIAEHAITQGWDDTMFKKAQDDVFGVVAVARTEAGRSLEANKYKLASRRLQAAFGKLDRTLNPREQAEFLDLVKRGGLDNPRQVERFTARLGDPKASEYVWEYWYSSILSGPPTHMINTLSNTLWQAFQAPHGALTAGIDKTMSMFRGGRRDYLLREMIPSWTGVKTGFKKGAKGAAEILKTGKSTEWESKIDTDIGGAILGAFERSPNKILRKAAPYVTMPSRFLGAMDVWAKSIAFDSKLAALAKSKGLTPERATREMLDKAGEYARYATFTDEPGKIASYLIGIRDNPDHPLVGGLMRLVMPFVSTPGNLMKRGLEMTPGIGLAMTKNQKPAQVIAKQIEGLVLAAAIFNKVDKGEITGAAPTGKGAREIFYGSGKLPWSIKIGDKWVQYRRIEPFNMPLAATVISYQAIKDAKTDEDKSKTAWTIINNLKEHIIDSSYLQGIQNLFSPHGRLEGATQRTLASFVPYSSFGRSISRATESAVTGTAKPRETKSLAGAVSQVVPMGYLLTNPQLDVLGNEQEIQGGPGRQFFPIKYAEERPDTLYAELDRLGVSAGHPKQELTLPQGETVKLNDRMYRDYQMRLGEHIQNRLQRLMSTDSYGRLPDEKKAHLIKSIISKTKDIELRKMKNEYKYKKAMQELE